MAYSDIILTDNPIAYWKLNETSGTTAVDSSGHGRNGVIGAGVVLADRTLIRGESAAPKFIGDTTSYIRVPDSPELNLGSLTNWTVEAVVSASAIQENTTGLDRPKTIVGNFSSSSSGTVSFLLGLASLTTTPRVQFDAGTGVGGAKSQDVPINRIYHLAIVRNGTSVILYVNGSVIANMDVGALVSSVPTGDDLFIGGHNTQAVHCSKSWINNVALYDTSLSPSRILARAEKVIDIYAERIYSLNPSAYWKFNETINRTQAYDYSGNNLNLIWNTPPSLSGGLRDGSDSVRFNNPGPNLGYQYQNAIFDFNTTSAKTFEILFRHVAKPEEQALLSYWGAYDFFLTIGGTSGPSQKINKLTVTVSSNGAFTPPTLNTTFVDNQLYHLVVTKGANNNTFSFYVNGVLDSTFTAPDLYITSTLSPTLYIGNFGAIGAGNNPFAGYLSDIAYYSSSFTPTQVTNSYTSSLSTTIQESNEGVVFLAPLPGTSLGSLTFASPTTPGVLLEVQAGSYADFLGGIEIINSPSKLELTKPSSFTRFKGVTSALVPMTPNIVYLLQVKGIYENLRKAREKKDYVPAQLGGISGQRSVSDEALVLTMTDFDFN